MIRTMIRSLMALDIVTDHLAGNRQYQHIITEDQKLFTTGYTG
ncbi:MAG: hypothetical protein P1S46_12345 [bacterium]|nr:hypothetical protein [bacterium]